MVHDYIPIDVAAIPYQQNVELIDNEYIFKFAQNSIDGNFIVDLFDYNGNLLVSGEPIILNQPLFRNMSNPNLPIETITPIDESGNATEINEDNLGTTVQLAIDDLGGD